MSPIARFRIVVVFMICVCAIDAAATAQPGHPKNAATWYQKAIDQMNRLSVDEWNTILFMLREGNLVTPTPELRSALAKAAPLISAYQQGSRQEYADWGLDRSAGIELMLPHMTEVRKVARAVHVSAMVRLHDGDAAGAAHLLASTYRATAHVADDQTLISSLVAQQTFHLVDGGVQHAIDSGALGPSEAVTLLREMQRLAAMNDPLNYVGSAVAEQEVIVGWLETMRDVPEDRALINMFVGGEDERFDSIMSLTPDEFDVAVAQYDHVMDRVVDIMSIDEPEIARAEMAALEAEIEAGEHGPLMALMPAWSRLLENRLRFEDALEKRMESLRAIAMGEVEPEELANAAVWYLRAFEMIARMEPEALDLLRSFSVEEELNGEKGEHTNGRAMEPALMLSQRIFDVLEEASNIRRCDFSIVRNDKVAIAPAYAGGMRDALRLVHADALRFQRAGKPSETAERLATGYRMIAHFSEGWGFVPSIVSHRAFLEAHDLIQLLIEDERLADEDRKPLASSLERIDAGDAFGYIASRRRTLEQLRREAALHDRRAEEARLEALRSSPELAEAAAIAEELAPMPTNVGIIDKADDDALLYYAALFQYFDRPGTGGFDEQAEAYAEEFERERWMALRDVLDLDELIAARAEAPHTFGDRIRSRSRGALHNLDVRQLNLLADRRHRARGDIRATAGLLRVTPKRASDEVEEE